MKIFFYINTISSGGAERVLTNLATEMSTRGHECVLITSFPCSWEYSYGEDVQRISLDLNKIEKEIGLKKFEFNNLERQTADLKKMEEERQEIESNFANVEDKKQEIEKIKIELDELKSEISLYSELDSFIEYGIYPLPQYGELSSKQYNERLIQIRNEQKGLIKNSKAYIVPEEIEITGNANYDKQLAQKQGRLLITAFNSQCDYLISKVSTKNYEATMRKIDIDISVKETESGFYFSAWV